MNDVLDLRPKPAAAPPKPASWFGRYRRRLAAAAGGTLLLGVIVAGAVWWTGRPGMTIPKPVAEQVLFPLYTIKKFPGSYTVDKDSYRVQEGVVLFRATNDEGHQIYVSEQKRSQKLDMTAFYQQQLSATKNLQDVPYPSVIGRVSTGDLMLSITTETTWLIVTSRGAGEADMRAIAGQIHPR